VKNVKSQTEADVCLSCPERDPWLITGSGSSVALFSLPLAFKSRLISPSVPLKTAPAPASCYCTGFESNPFTLPGFLSCMSDPYNIEPYHLSVIIYQASEWEGSDYTQRCLEYYPISLSGALVDFNQIHTHTHIQTISALSCTISLFALHVRNTMTHRYTKHGCWWLFVIC